MTASSAPPAGLLCEDIPGHPDFRSLLSLPMIDLDLRYASRDNFVGRAVYGGLDCAWLRREAADALEQAALWLAGHKPGWRLRVLDALRPQRVQEALYAELAGTPLALYLAHPERGSIHSFGMAVDVTLLDEAGAEIDMGSSFDEMDAISHPEFEAELLAQGRLRLEHLQARGWLRAALRQAGFHGITTEWWHFDFGDRTQVRATLPRVL
ncbi:M15 family metallopeptidase [Inhella gelatinilytica]|uniref:D-alanyl-D-alanine dipeptidase n=1 Tax=Inhella gelatinilytica TaxID=2795030 RepID=A0A931IZ08_9BURK|nr:M15 family metallopeptidase [Inhella gelatinilytica]MBH9552593.1 M15 family metallopeptidase [Inhella gelatinilytica]